MVGKRIANIKRTQDEKYLLIEFDDGTAVEISGGGYDGLWDDVFTQWVR